MTTGLSILIVDDSALVRQSLAKLVERMPFVASINLASDPYMAVEKIKQETPDVMILDIEMPRMDGLTFLRKIMSQHPIPVIICSTLTTANTDAHFKALEFGAVDIVTKPKLGTKTFFEEAYARFSEAIKNAANVDMRRMSLTKAKLQRQAETPGIKKQPSVSLKTTEKVILIGASTGGTEAIYSLLRRMPRDCPAIAIVQHMPEGFTKSFAKRLDNACEINVKEASDGDTLLRGHALVAPGNFHLEVHRSGARYYVKVTDGPLVTRHRPSVDVLFNTASEYNGDNFIATILTGMGGDGAKGMLKLKNAGAYTIGQDEASSVVYGMPKEAHKLGAVAIQLPLDKITDHIIQKAFDD